MSMLKINMYMIYLICLQNVCKYGFVKSIKFLLDKGAKPNQVAIENACNFGSKKILQLLNARNVNSCLLLNNLPTVKPDLKTLQKICEKGQSVALMYNNIWKNDDTCIISAAKNGYSDFMISSDNEIQEKAFVMAAENGFISVLEVIEKNKKINIKVAKKAFINAAYYGKVYVLDKIYKTYNIDKQTILSAKAWAEYNSEHSFVPDFLNTLL